MKIFFSALIVSIASISLAQTSSSSSLDTMYAARTANELTEAKVLLGKLRSNRATLCPLHRDKDSLGCLRSYLQTAQVSSSTQFVLNIALIPAAGLQDKAMGLQQSFLTLMSLECMITAIEHTDLSRFYLSQVKPKNAKEKADLASLMATEESLMAKALEKSNLLIEQNFSLVEKTRDLASAEALKVKMIADLKARHVKNKARSWSFVRPQ